MGQAQTFFVKEKQPRRQSTDFESDTNSAHKRLTSQWIQKSNLNLFKITTELISHAGKAFTTQIFSHYWIPRQSWDPTLIFYKGLIWLSKWIQINRGSFFTWKVPQPICEILRNKCYLIFSETYQSIMREALERWGKLQCKIDSWYSVVKSK